MDRRQFAKATALGLAGLAGCTDDGTRTVGGGDQGGDDPTATETDAGEATMTATESETASDSPTETATETSAGASAVSIASDELKKIDTDYSTEAFAFADVVNKGDAASGEITLKARFYDSEDNLLGDNSAYLVRLAPSETWKAAIWFLGEGEKVERLEVEGEYVEEAPNFTPDGIELTGSELSKGSNEATITGTLKNDRGEEVSYLEAHGLFYADETTILASDWTNQTEIPDGDTWKFEVRMGNTGGRVKDVASHKVVYTLSSY